jgi:hypothetical protein
MGSHLNGKHFSRDFVLGKIFPPGKEYGLNVSRRKLIWIQREVDQEVKVTMT